MTDDLRFLLQVHGANRGSNPTNLWQVHLCIFKVLLNNTNIKEYIPDLPSEYFRWPGNMIISLCSAVASKQSVFICIFQYLRLKIRHLADRWQYSESVEVELKQAMPFMQVFLKCSKYYMQHVSFYP